VGGPKNRSALGAVGVGDIVTESFGGTAICDWLGQMHTDQAQRHPDAAVVEFSGNAFTPCIKAPVAPRCPATPISRSTPTMLGRYYGR
jgi:hypothetical protein